MVRAFPAVPLKVVNPDGSMTPEFRRFLQSVFSQLGGANPVDFTSFQEMLAFDEKQIYLVAGM